MQTIFWVGLLSICFACISQAQTATASLRGQAVDPQGKSVPGAHIAITDANNKVARTQTAGESGEFSFTGLPPATYRLDAEAAGFKKLTIERVTAVVDVTIEVPVHLEVGDLAQVVTVASSQEALETASATLGNPFDGNRIEELPLNARNIIGLLSLQPGVTRFGEVNGARRDQANVTLDGADNNYQLSGLDPIALALGFGPQAFGSVLRATPESVEEFRVVTSGPPGY
jgi:hypothetical protein